MVKVSAGYYLLSVTFEVNLTAGGVNVHHLYCTSSQLLVCVILKLKAIR